MRPSSKRIAQLLAACIAVSTIGCADTTPVPAGAPEEAAAPVERAADPAAVTPLAIDPDADAAPAEADESAAEPTLAAPAIAGGTATLPADLLTRVFPTPTVPVGFSSVTQPTGSLASVDPVPSGVEAQLSISSGGYAIGPTLEDLFPCASAATTGTEPEMIVPDATMPIASVMHVCLVGFLADQDIVGEVLLPSGDRRAIAIAPNAEGVGHWRWVRLPGAQRGEYLLTATQGSLVANGSFTVVDATVPRMAMEPARGAPGARFVVGLAGFAPFEPLTLHVYRFARGSDCSEGYRCWQYATTLASLAADATGEASTSFTTAADDPPNEYLLAAHGGNGSVVQRVFGLSP